MKTFALDDDLTFGKHKGKQVEDVVQDEPDYIRWLMENGAADFDNEVIEKLEKREKGNR